MAYKQHVRALVEDMGVLLHVGEVIKQLHGWWKLAQRAAHSESRNGAGQQSVGVSLGARELGETVRSMKLVRN